MVSKVERPPGRFGCGPKNEEMGAGIVGKKLWRAGMNEILEPGVRHLDCGMQGFHSIQHLFHAIGDCPRDKIVHHAEGEFRLRHPHPVSHQ